MEMELNTVKIGKISFSEDNVYNLPGGLYGFEDEKSFVLIQTENIKPFYWFQSTKSDWLAFLLCDPRLFIPDYRLDIRKEHVAELEIRSAEDSFIFVILSVPQDPKKMTANLQGPLVFNMKTRLVKQMVIDGAGLRHPVFQEAQEAQAL